ncbi:MAG: prepilin peptidase [Candidatus Xenobia bacterium]
MDDGTAGMVQIFGTVNPFSMVVVFWFGCIIGSFLNVCIYRLPVGRSIVFPPSACGSCGVPLTWWQNIPILSYLLLRGACARCHTSYSPRYALIELLTGLTALTFWVHFQGAGWPFFYYFAMACILIVVFFIDLDHWIIPDQTSVKAMWVGLAGSMLLPGRAEIFTGLLPPLNLTHWPAPLTHLLASALGALVGWGFFASIAIIGALYAHQEAMGGGDVRLAGMIGAFLGWEKAMLSFIVAFWVGGLCAIPLFFLSGRRRKAPLPFGTYMALGVFVVILFGDRITEWFMSHYYYPY